MKKEIITNNAPKALGAYSKGLTFSNFIQTSGQLPIDINTQEIPEGIEKQTELVLKNAENILKEAEFSFDDTIKVNIYLKDMNDFQKMNEIYGTFFKEPYPTRSVIQAAKLPKDALIEIDVFGYKK